MAISGKDKKLLTKEVVLSGHLSLGSVGEIRTRLLQALDEADIVNVRLLDVLDVDLSMIQIICAAHRSALVRKKSLVLQNNLPLIFTQFIEESGLQGHIGCSQKGKECCVWES